MEFVLLIVGVLALATVACMALWFARDMHQGAKTALGDHLETLEKPIQLPDKNGTKQSTTALAIVDLDLQLEQLHRGRCIAQSGLLLVAVVAIICATVLASAVSRAPEPAKDKSVAAGATNETKTSSMGLEQKSSSMTNSPTIPPPVVLATNESAQPAQ
mgnify:CR=1 FL=1